MNAGSLPTDDAFLDGLFEAPADPFNPADDPAFLAEATAALLQNGVIAPRADPGAFVHAMFDPRRNFRGLKSTLLIDLARKALPQTHHHLLSTPLAFLHLQAPGGFAIRTPRGNAAIVLNLGVLLHAHMLGRCMLALTSWSSPAPFCRDHEPAAFVHAIICLARFAYTGDDDHLRRITVWNCPSIDPLDLRSARVSVAVELFVLLHEYGHVACGHLDGSRIERILGLDMYAQSRAQEHEADDFAFDHHKRWCGEEVSGVTVALLFRFFDLIEHLIHGAPRGGTSHPAGRDRWNDLKARFGLTDPEGELFGRVESMFDMILSVRNGIDQGFRSKR